MIKKHGLTLCSIAIFAGMGFSPVVIAASAYQPQQQDTHSTIQPSNSADADVDEVNDDFDNGQDFGQDQSSAPTQEQISDQTMGGNISSPDDGDEN